MSSTEPTPPPQKGHGEAPESASGAAGSPLDPRLLGRGLLGGILMGLANLVPGISGGTMLLSAGVYPNFVDAVASVTTLRFRWHQLVLLGVVVIAAMLAILLLAGPVKDLVVGHRWIMYSLFIGLTLGGVPVVGRLVGKLSRSVVVGAVAGLVTMILLTMVRSGGTEAGSAADPILLFVAGLAGGAAMILPGLSGGYLLLVLGQYVAILGAINAFKEGLSAGEAALILEPAKSLVVVGIGVVIGVVGVSNLMKMLLRRHPRPTLGVLMGLLLGAVVGLWPFQEPQRPELGDVIKGVRIESVAQIDELGLEDWPTHQFTPSAGQATASILLVVVGFGISWGVSRIGRGDEPN